jgi:hypothetical protein
MVKLKKYLKNQTQVLRIKTKKNQEVFKERAIWLRQIARDYKQIFVWTWNCYEIF